MATWIMSCTGSLAAPQLTYAFEASGPEAARKHVEDRIEFVCASPHYYRVALYNEEGQAVQFWQVSRRIEHRRVS